MEKIPAPIQVSTIIEEGESDEFSLVDITFRKDDKGSLCFIASVDDDWYLCSDGKLRQDHTQACEFLKNNVKDGKMVKEYPHIINRAMECAAFCLAGRFEKIET